MIRIFIDTSNHLSAVRIDFTEKSLDCQSKKKRALKNYYTLSRCNRVLTLVIRDFWTFSEISLPNSDLEGVIACLR
ncbi:MAG: hypothetical protein AB1502_10645 [Thermodesulfobacteriota bacterium]